jgi:tripeptide aminopeptidase
VTASATAPDTGELQRRYLSGTFAELCRIESPSGRERACAQRVIAELRALGVTVHEDHASSRVGSDCGNLLARIPRAHSDDDGERQRGGDARGEGARGEGERGEGERGGDARGEGARGEGERGGDARGERRSLLLCAHLDTVPLQAPVEPVLVDGYWENANAGILGADNKAAIAVLLALARHACRQGSPVDLELLFTVGEETSLAGARAFDASLLRSDFGYVFDHASPIGEIVTDSPTHFRIDASFRGAAAHAGIRPQDGRSAILAAARAVASMRTGRLDEASTVNVGTISGGTAINVVPEHCSLALEARALGDRHAESIVAEIVDRLHDAANLPDCDCDVDVSVQRTFSGFHLSSASPAVRAAESALRACGHEPTTIASGGASDANALLAQGFHAVNLANGTERNHEPGERVSVLALEQMLDVALALTHEAAAAAAGPAGRPRGAAASPGGAAVGPRSGAAASPRDGAAGPGDVAAGPGDGAASPSRAAAL